MGAIVPHSGVLESTSRDSLRKPSPVQRALLVASYPRKVCIPERFYSHLRSRCDDTAFLKKLTYRIALLTVFLRLFDHDVGRSKPTGLPLQSALNCPVQYSRCLGFELFR